MNCIEARRMIAPFVNKELTDKETEQFLKHIDHCSDCMDELDVYYTVHRALASLDSGKHHEFNFQKMLKEDIRSSRHAVAGRKVTRTVRMLLVAAAEALLLFSIYTGYEMRQGEIQQNTFERAIYRLHAQPPRKIKAPESP